MKTPTDATKVYNAVAATASTGTTQNVGIVFDLALTRTRTLIGQEYVQDRLRGFPLTDTRYLIKELYTTTTGAESSGDGYAVIYDVNNTQTSYKEAAYYSGYPYILHAFRRAPGFFDVVAYAGSRSAFDGGSSTISHNLGVAPELMIIKSRTSASYGWAIYSAPTGNTHWLDFDAFGANINSFFWNNTSPTSSNFTVGSSTYTNLTGQSYIAYLFASCPGVSKIGSYTGTGTTLQINCGFTTGARFIIIKRTDGASGSNWYVYDSARGISSANDPYLFLNSTAAEVTNTDYIDPYSAGFEISSTAPAAINANGGSFIFLAVA
jgi:hypothetical protein